MNSKLKETYDFLIANDEFDMAQNLKATVEQVRHCLDDIVWMAIRYAHGRHTYAPQTVRDAVHAFKSIFPDWEVKQDITIVRKADEQPDADGSLKLESDYLYDLFENSTE